MPASPTKFSVLKPSALAIALALLPPVVHAAGTGQQVDAARSISYRFDVPAQELGQALQAFARAARQQVSFDGDQARARASTAVSGNFTAEQALRQLLGGTGFTYRYDRGVWIVTRDQSHGSGDQPPPPSAKELDTVAVTGSRIQRAGFDTLEPATVIQGEQYLEAGLTNVADLLGRTPSFGAGRTPDGFQSRFGAGVNFANRFNLGTNRTLTVVNGRRFVSSNTPGISGPSAPGSQVDLNAIPVQLIERVENLAVGGAPTYGADAIAGTLNLILKNDYEGAEVSVGTGLSERGDNERRNLSAIAGKSLMGGRGNVTLAVSYDNVDGVLMNQRDVYRQGLFFTVNPMASILDAWPGRTPENDGRYNTGIPFNTGPGDGIPNSILIRDRRIFTTPTGGLVFSGFMAGSGNTLLAGPDGSARPLAFDRDGQLVHYDQGYGFSAVDASGGDGMSLVDQGQITSDLERKTVNLLSRFALTDQVDAFFEGTYYRMDARELTSEYYLNSVLFEGSSGAIFMPADHPLLTGQARRVLAGHGLDSFMLSRASGDIAMLNSRNESSIVRGVVGLEGTFQLGNRDFAWEAYGNYGRSRGEFFSADIDVQRFTNSLNVMLDAGGQAVCAGRPMPGVIVPGGLQAVPDAACVPLDLFGEGRPSEAARNYVVEPTRAIGRLEQKVHNINVSSSLVDLWSGPLLYNVGFERRTESGLFAPDDFLRLGLGRMAAVAPTSGSFTTNEWFGEVLIPLVGPGSDIPLFRKLDVTGKYRRVHSTVNGGFGTYTYGLQWKPAHSLELRGNFTRSLRAPAITELFAPQAQVPSFTTDPCDSRNINSGTRPDIRAANCSAFLDYYGLDTFTSIAQNATVIGTTGGNATLKNESSDSLTYGFTWAPSSLKGLVVSADYYDIDISDAIVSLSNSDIAAACFDNEAFDASNVPTANAYCGRLVRNADGQIVDWNSTYINGAGLRLKSYSAEAQYAFNAGNIGAFHVGVSGYFLDSLQQSPTGIVTTELAGTVGNPRRQYQANAGWKRGRLGLGLSANYWSGVKTLVGTSTLTPEDRDILGLDNHVLLHGHASVELGSRGTLRLAVSNLLDKDPPFTSTLYDTLGRRYFMSYEWKY